MFSPHPDGGFVKCFVKCFVQHLTNRPRDFDSELLSPNSRTAFEFLVKHRLFLRGNRNGRQLSVEFKAQPWRLSLNSRHTHDFSRWPGWWSTVSLPVSLDVMDQFPCFNSNCVRVHDLRSNWRVSLKLLEFTSSVVTRPRRGPQSEDFVKTSPFVNKFLLWLWFLSCASTHSFYDPQAHHSIGFCIPNNWKNNATWFQICLVTRVKHSWTT